MNRPLKIYNTHLMYAGLTTEILNVKIYKMYIQTYSYTLVVTLILCFNVFVFELLRIPQIVRGIVRKFNMHQNDVLKCRICTYNGPTIGGTYNIFNVFIYLFSLFDVF